MTLVKGDFFELPVPAPVLKPLTLKKLSPKKVTAGTKKIKVQADKGAKVTISAKGLKAKKKIATVKKANGTKALFTFTKLNFKRVKKNRKIKITAVKKGHKKNTITFKRK